MRKPLLHQNLKNAKVLPLLKGGTKLEINNYRPISLLKNSCKIIEKNAFSFIQLARKMNLLHDKQFGFREKFSTTDVLAEMTECIWLGADKNIKCCILSI